MANHQLHIFMPLGNVDESILKLKLNEGFQFDSMTYNEGQIFLSKLEKLPIENFGQWRHAHTVFSHGGMYYIKKSFEFDLSLKENGIPNSILICINLPETLLKKISRIPYAFYDYSKKEISFFPVGMSITAEREFQILSMHKEHHFSRFKASII